MRDQCQGITKGGKRCRTKAQPGSTWCVFHDPARAEQRSQWSAKGGAGRSNTARARKGLPCEQLSTDELLAYLSLAFKQTLVQKLPAGVFNALANGARAMKE